jgi:mono/diheme cytochrome c family protein
MLVDDCYERSNLRRKEEVMTARNICVGFLSLLFLAFLCVAQQKEVQKVEIKKVPITHVDPTSGEQMYVSYCAACHGRDGKGYGPAAPALKTPLPDLTTMAKRNHGEYPALQVMQTIRGDVASPVHGDKDMPVWGPAFRSLHFDGDPSIDVQRRISSLNGYIESLQQK